MPLAKSQDPRRHVRSLRLIARGIFKSPVFSTGTWLWIKMKGDKLDRKDIALLEALEEDSRQSLKVLAEDLGIKTSTIYHRLHRLVESNVLEGFTIVMNPEYLNLTEYVFLTVSLKSGMIQALDLMFVKSLAQYLAKEFKQILFVAIGDKAEDAKQMPRIYIISVHQSVKDKQTFIQEIKEIAYVEHIKITRFSSIVKGNKIFRFDPIFFQKGPKRRKKQEEELDDLGADIDLNMEDLDELEVDEEQDEEVDEPEDASPTGRETADEQEVDLAVDIPAADLDMEDLD